MNNDLNRNPGIQRLVIFLLILAAAKSGGAQSNSPISVALEKQNISYGEPVLMQILVKNTASVPLELDLGLNGKDNVSVVVTQPDGKKMEKPQPAPRNGVAFFGWHHLERNEDYSEVLVLNEWFKFRQIGRYQIQIQLREPATVGTEKVPLDPFSLTLDVSPANIEELREACKNLIARVKRHESGQENIAAESALRYVDDPAMLPFWEERATDKSVAIREIAFSNLANIGNMDVVEILSRAIDSHDKDTKSLARSALEQIVRASSDADVRARAEQALSRR